MVLLPIKMCAKCQNYDFFYSRATFKQSIWNIFNILGIYSNWNKNKWKLQVFFQVKFSLAREYFDALQFTTIVTLLMSTVTATSVGKAEAHVMLISSTLDQMNRWADVRMFDLLDFAWLNMYSCHPQTLNKVALPLFFLIMKWGWGRLSHRLTDLEESQQMSDSHLEGITTINSSCICEPSPAFMLGWVLMSNTVTHGADE